MIYYKIIQETKKQELEDQINANARNGWRVVNYAATTLATTHYYSALLEIESNEI